MPIPKRIRPTTKGADGFAARNDCRDCTYDDYHMPQDRDEDRKEDGQIQVSIRASTDLNQTYIEASKILICNVGTQNWSRVSPEGVECAKSKRRPLPHIKGAGLTIGSASTSS